MLSCTRCLQAPEEAAPENKVPEEWVGPDQSPGCPAHDNLQTGEQEHEREQEAEKKILSPACQSGQFL
ncbi:hypothetical protein DGMP_35630 [Desulfomarina profundi]|uniref:Uncharacterized protein n=1 Tax=Desulfomarina profundi TaxID=2772557 RepID=A0A8D5JQV7_9BACT|nr:hypothetical protein DGMP_35630 [Desulfomarina profundi]